MSKLADAWTHAHDALTRYLIPLLVDIVLNEYYLHTCNAHILSEFVVPFNYMYSDGYTLTDMYHPNPACNISIAKLENWDSKIRTIYYWNLDKVSWDPSWTLVGRCTNGIYFVYIACCTYSGFDACGGMNLWCAYNVYDLLTYCADDKIRLKMSAQQSTCTDSN